MLRWLCGRSLRPTACISAVRCLASSASSAAPAAAVLPTPSATSRPHVLLVVHGIGEQIEDNFFSASLQTCVNQLRTTLARVGKSHFGAEFPIDIRHIEWHSALWNRPDAPLRFLSRISPTSLGALRRAVNETSLDVLLFMTPRYRRALLHSVAVQLNALYKTVTAQYGPDVPVSIYSHSLGSVITHELAVAAAAPPSPADEPRHEHQRQPHHNQNQHHHHHHHPHAPGPRLHFVPRVLFNVGSPLGLFALLRAESADDCALPVLASGTRLLNVFHPFDPIAFRLEPLLWPSGTGAVREPRADAPAPAVLPRADHDRMVERARQAVVALRRQLTSAAVSLVSAERSLLPNTGAQTADSAVGASLRSLIASDTDAGASATGADVSVTAATAAAAAVTVSSDNVATATAAPTDAAAVDDASVLATLSRQLQRLSAQLQAAPKAAVTELLTRRLAALEDASVPPRERAADEIRAFLATGRVDFVLPEALDLSAVRAHTAYWDSEDTALLLLHALQYGDAGSAA